MIKQDISTSTDLKQNKRTPNTQPTSPFFSFQFSKISLSLSLALSLNLNRRRRRRKISLSLSLCAWKSNNRLTSPSSFIAWSSRSNSSTNGNPRIQSKPNKNFWSPSCHSERGISFVCLSIRVSFAWETQSPFLKRPKALSLRDPKPHRCL